MDKGFCEGDVLGSDYVKRLESEGCDVMFGAPVESMKFGLPIVSVGSGNGIIEGVARRRFQRSKLGDCPEIICVDPFPNMYHPADQDVWNYVSVKPSFSTTDELVKKRPKLFETCVLWLIWPAYFLDYDVSAILLLRPRAIVFMTDLFGTGCSPTVNKWLNQKCNIPARFKNMEFPGSNLVADARLDKFPPFNCSKAEVHFGTVYNNAIGNAVIKTQHRALAIMLLSYNTSTATQISPTFNKEVPINLIEMMCRSFEHQCNNRNCKNVGETKKCGGCAIAFYCSKTCQKTDWAVHKQYCKYELK